MSSSDDTLINALKKRIPGYGAYREQEARRDDDRLTREFLVQRLGECKASMDRMGVSAVASGNLDAPIVSERLRTRVDLAQSRLAAAMEGYAAWFSDRKVDAALLQQIAKLDENLVSLVDQIQSLSSDEKHYRDSEPSELRDAIELLHQRIDRRHELLKHGV
ncbi:MAG: hypothetical protein R3C53_15785 [Pirellulaceae bacterium]